MTDKGRLEEIKEKYLVGVHILSCTYAVGDDSSREGYSYILADEDYHWLMEQAERVEELEEEKEQLEEDNAMKNQYVHELKVQNERYKQALEHFANLGTNHDTTPTLVMNGNEVFMLLDYIKSMDEYVRCKAQKALEG